MNRILLFLYFLWLSHHVLFTSLMVKNTYHQSISLVTSELAATMIDNNSGKDSNNRSVWALTFKWKTGKLHNKIATHWATNKFWEISSKGWWKFMKTVKFIILKTSFFTVLNTDGCKTDTSLCSNKPQNYASWKKWDLHW